MTCHKCNRRLETLRNAGFEVIGYEVPREQGGTNHLLGRKRTGKMICPGCLTKLKYGITEDQLTLA